MSSRLSPDAYYACPRCDGPTPRVSITVTMTDSFGLHSREEPLLCVMCLADIAARVAAGTLQVVQVGIRGPHAIQVPCAWDWRND